MKIDILLRLEVDVKGACGQDETEVTVNAKIRHCISELVGCGLLKVPSISLYSSAAAEEVDISELGALFASEEKVFQMIKTSRCVRLTD